jgi:predicted acylesterase/phospholipase RssA
VADSSSQAETLHQLGGLHPEAFGISFSGGGFRATLFHLGVVRLLYEANLLHRVQFISGVSGGAILAAHLGLNWARYTGSETAFQQAAEEIVRFSQRDVRNRILRRWILGWLTLVPRLLFQWSRVELLRREYRSLYGDKRLRDLPNVYEQQGPRTVLQASSMTTGMPCTFGRSGLMLYKEEADGRGINLGPDQELTFATGLSVAHGVAASSAFPPMFPPLKIDNRLLECAQEEFPFTDYLTDGGVFDNMGMDRPLRWFTSAAVHPHPADRIASFLISDAEGPFNPLAGKPWRYKFALPRNLRATEVLMRRASTLNWKFLTELHLNLIRIPEAPRYRQVVDPKAAQNFRTDLDRFSNLEVDELVCAGSQSAQVALGNNHWIATNFPNTDWRPLSAPRLTPERRQKLLARARFRSWWPLLLAPSDPAWWALVALAGLLIYFFA